MTRSIQICTIFVIIQWLVFVNSAPLLQGISITRNFDISLKPFQFKPITFIREKWGPFGAFGRRHSVTKRQAEPGRQNVPNSVIPLVTNVGNGIIPIPAPVTLPSALNNEISISPSSISPISMVSHIPVPVTPPPAPVYENVAEGPNFLIPSAQVNIASSTPLLNITPPPPIVRNNFIQPPLRGAVSEPPIVSVPSVITPPPVTPYRLNTAITQSIPVNPYLNLLNNPPPIYDSGPTRVNLLVPNNDQTQLVNSELPSATRRGILVRFGEFFLQLLTRFITTSRFNRANLPPTQ
ncbi:uncharacterized protein LOC116413051 [Galleria mellonella]|uniref:Uncharacterized protein LOC116413051 n=1 Tax=Galleria mellonella TaxID=7137 RepID=A0A6J3C0C9_GALME|nr:uncharacterized protein LOC116413051 [Galleria mellonella]